MIRRVGSWLFGFARFWYEFVIGDDPLMALGVATALGATAILLRSGHNAWWLTPPLVIVVLGVSIRRMSPG